MPLLIINQSEVTELLPMHECIGVMRDAFTSLARGEAIVPLRPVMKLPENRGVLAMMPGYMARPESIGIKVITVFPGNLGTPLDSHQGAVMLFDAHDGRLIGMMDASAVTSIRTAAASALATDLLARQGAADLAILGAGVQARTHLEAMRAVRRIVRVRVWSRTPEHAQAFADREGKRHEVDIEIASNARDAVLGADIISTTTAAHHPVLHGEWVSDGAHINAVGSASPIMRELDTSAVVNARLFVDSRESLLNEAGDFLIPKAEGAVDDSHIVGEIGEILLGRVQGRVADSEITLFKSLGVAVQDVAVANHVYEKARELGVGTELEFGGLRDPAD